jgi:hypothetical protein
MNDERTYSLAEVVEGGFEAYCHPAENGVWWLLHGCWALRSDPTCGARTLVTDLTLAPEGPWLPTAWGEAELADGRAIDP